DIKLYVAIYIDNQASIKSSDPFNMKSDHYLICHFCSTIKKLKKESHSKKLDINVCWVSEWESFRTWQRADEEAKKVAKNPQQGSQCCHPELSALPRCKGEHEALHPLMSSLCL
ncbi:hypothetical protein PAXRUDRAFT_145705, partial [Paxillus rubicundulus Ve08.2h10]